MKLSLNLASRTYLNQRALRQIYLLLGLLFLVLLAFQIKIYLTSHQQRLGLEKNIADLQTQLHGEPAPQLTADQISLQQQEHRQAEMLLQRDAFRWTALFDRFERLLPSGVSIRSFNPNYQQGQLQINGVARQLSDLQTLLNNLHGEKFRQVFLESQDWVEVSDGTGGEKPALGFSIRLEGVF